MKEEGAEMDSVMRSIILLQFVLCVPPLLADCCLSGFKIRILKVALLAMMVALVLCDFCLLEILGIGLVLLNFCVFYRIQNRGSGSRRFLLFLLILSLMSFVGRIAWRGVSESDRQEGQLSCAGRAACAEA